MFGPLTYLLESGSDRIGALDFQASAETYVGPGDDDGASLEELQQAAELVDERQAALRRPGPGAAARQLRRRRPPEGAAHTTAGAG